MKTIFKYIVVGVVCLAGFNSCIPEDMNQNPNAASQVPAYRLMSGTQKYIMDYVYDLWFGGRQCMVYSQQWAQVNYTEEDRYQIRESVNNNYFNYLYMGVANLQEVERLNTDPEKAEENAPFGANANQIAAAKILKVWLMDIITDTWGSVPYSDVGKLASENLLYCKYDDQKELYAALIAELDAAVGMIDVNEVAFTAGDNIFGGNAAKWKKFGNSLKCRLAVHMSKVDPNWKSYITAAVASGVFESNDDAANFAYVSSGTDYCQFYAGTVVDGRNDFTIAKPFYQILKGEADALNGKSHPWAGTEDPRLAFFSPNATSGMPYGVPSSVAGAFSEIVPDWTAAATAAGHLAADFTIPLMTYAEVQFIISESKNFSDAEFKAGIKASIEYWAEVYGKKADAAAISDYIAAVGSANAEKVAVQKYIDLWLNGTEAWTEIRRTGYPDQILRPGEISAKNPDDDSDIAFEPLSEVKNDIIARVKYPTNESTLNGKNWEDAVAKLQDGTNNYYTKMFWDARTSTYDHPANK